MHNEAMFFLPQLIVFVDKLRTSHVTQNFVARLSRLRFATSKRARSKYSDSGSNHAKEHDTFNAYQCFGCGHTYTSSYNEIG